MCGICGVLNFQNQPVSEEDIRTMMSAQKHRGPDDEGCFIEGSTGLGFVRLSILDLSTAGNQPMYFEDARYVIVYNGEIFNYIELKGELIQLGHSFKTGTDTEVLINSYIEWGENCVNHFNGMWAFMILDRKLKRAFASRDRYGIKPFYYYANKDLFAFASEIKPLLTLLTVTPVVNERALFDYLVFNRTDQSEDTFFKGIKKLQHGHNILINLEPKRGEHFFTIEKWYDLREKVIKAEGIKTPEEFREELTSSIKLRLRSDVPLGVCLSGGLDSSSITGILLNQLEQGNVKTFSAVYNKGDFGDESEYIGEFSGLISQMHFTKPNTQSLIEDLKQFVKVHEEPLPSTGPYAQFKVMELAKSNVVVTLDGQGADELLAGYPYFFGFYFKYLLRKAKIPTLAKELYHYFRIHRSLYGLLTMGFFLLPSRIRTKLRVSQKGYLDKLFYKRISKSGIISKELYGSSSLQEALLNHFEYKLEHLLKWEDRNSMWFSIEARVPFLDHQLVERTLSMDPHLIINRGETKYILRKAMEGVIPESIRKRQDKMGFGTPMDKWFREDEFKQIVDEVISSKSFKERGIIDPVIAQKMYHNHLGGGIDISKEIWKWVNLELWFREFIDAKR